MKSLYTVADIQSFSQAYGSMGMNRAQVINTQINSSQNEIEVIPSKTINISLVKMIDQLSALDGYLKQKLDNQKLVDRNLQLSEREADIEKQVQKPEIIQQDAERVNGSSAGGLGLLGLGAAGLLAFEPVREALSGLVTLAIDAGKFATDVLKSVNGLFAAMFSGTPDTSVQIPTEGGVAPSTAGMAPIGEGPVTADAQPVLPTPQQEKPGLIASTITGAMAGGAAGAILPFVKARTGAMVGAAVGAYNYFSTPSTPAASTSTSATGGSVSTPTGSKSSSTTESKPETKTSQGTPANVIQVNHPETGQGWSIAGATDANGRPVVFSKEGAIAFSKMMQDSNGMVKPSDVASSKRSVQKNKQVDGATNSPHLRGVAMDIHGSSSRWIRQHGHKYGWKPHDYKGTHGGHFVFGGAGMAPDEGSAGGGIIGQAEAAISSGIEETAKILGAVAGVLVGKTSLKDLSTPLADTSSIIKNSAIKEKSAMVDANIPKPPIKPSPPNINMSGTNTIQNPPTMSDRNRLYYYVDRFNFGEISKPTVLSKSAVA